MSLDRRNSNEKSDSHLSDEKAEFQRTSTGDHLKVVDQVPDVKQITEASNGESFRCASLGERFSALSVFPSRFRCRQD